MKAFYYKMYLKLEKHQKELLKKALIETLHPDNFFNFYKVKVSNLSINQYVYLLTIK